MTGLRGLSEVAGGVTLSLPGAGRDHAWLPAHGLQTVEPSPGALEAPAKTPGEDGGFVGSRS